MYFILKINIYNPHLIYNRVLKWIFAAVSRSKVIVPFWVLLRKFSSTYVCWIWSIMRWFCPPDWKSKWEIHSHMNLLLKCGVDFHFCVFTIWYFFSYHNECYFSASSHLLIKRTWKTVLEFVKSSTKPAIIKT